MSGKFWDKGITLAPGCSKCSPGCASCWSESLGKRFPKHPNKPYVDEQGRFTGKVGWRIDLLKKALKSNAKVLSLWNDFYHPGISDEQRDEAWGLIAHSDKTVIICTKRPHIAAEYWKNWSNEPDDNEILKARIQHLVTVEDQTRMNERWTEALKIPGNVGLLIEPMLGPIDLWRELSVAEHVVVILGGETGPDARPMHPGWVRSVRNQCRDTIVPFFFKQWGQWVPVSQCDEDSKRRFAGKPVDFQGEKFYHLGTGKGGRFLDGREHNNLPWRLA